ncbi:MAG: hypothetical protein KY453_12005 [Gemmatimonadetes bacterium]|nr:hypothetical protein [Gemmatimonadota bacterium]
MLELKGLRHAEQALRVTPNSSRALEARGTLRYWKYLQSPELRPDEQRALLGDARRDLEAAVRIEPLLASAHSTLSHLLYREDMSSAMLAARRAYEADAYLEAAADVLLRLVLGNYDLENFDQMQRWCEEGARRFPENFRFTDCGLLMMTTRQAEPDVERAWRLRARLDSLSPESRREYDQVRGLALVGGVIARAAGRAAEARTLEDSARVVLDRTRGRLTPETAELRELIAHMYTLLGDNQTAIDLLRQHAAANPGISYEHHWRWRELRGLPEFQPLLEGH